MSFDNLLPLRHFHEKEAGLNKTYAEEDLCPLLRCRISLHALHRIEIILIARCTSVIVTVFITYTIANVYQCSTCNGYLHSSSSFLLLI